MNLTFHQLFVRNTTFLFIAQISTRILALISGVLLANYLGVENFGLYNFAIAFASLLIPLFDFGIDTAFIKDNAHVNNYQTAPVGTLLFLKFLISVCILSAALVFIPVFMQKDQKAYVQIAVLIIFIRTYTGSFSAIVRGNHRMDIEAIIQVSLKIFEIGAVITAFIIKAKISTLLDLLLISSSIQLVYSAVLINHYGYFKNIRIDVPSIKKMIQSGMPFVLTGISVTLYFQMNTVLLKYLSDEKTVGLYRSAFNLVYPLTAFSASIVVALFSMIAKLHKENKEEAVRLAGNSVFYSLMFAVPIAFGGTVLAYPLMNFLYSDSYSSASLTLQICIWWLPVVYVSNILGHILGSINRQKIVFYISLGNAIFNILANILLIPLFADKGVAMANVLTESVGLIISSAVVIHVFGNIYNFKRLLRLILAGSGILILYLFANTLNIFILILLGAVIYFVLLIMLKVVSKADLIKIKNVFFQKRSVNNIT